jgi:hypothetical protein
VTNGCTRRQTHLAALEVLEHGQPIFAKQSTARVAELNGATLTACELHASMKTVVFNDMDG